MSCAAGLRQETQNKTKKDALHRYKKKQRVRRRANRTGRAEGRTEATLIGCLALGWFLHAHSTPGRTCPHRVRRDTYRKLPPALRNRCAWYGRVLLCFSRAPASCRLRIPCPMHARVCVVCVRLQSRRAPCSVSFLFPARGVVPPVCTRVLRHRARTHAHSSHKP